MSDRNLIFRVAVPSGLKPQYDVYPLTPALRLMFIHIFSLARNWACGGVRLLMCVKNAKLRSVRAKAQVGVCLAPQPKGWG